MPGSLLAGEKGQAKRPAHQPLGSRGGLLVMWAGQTSMVLSGGPRGPAGGAAALPPDPGWP